MSKGVITSVADTALWMASVRSAESGRRDAVFTDPLAATLAGDRGRWIAASAPGSAAVAWGVVIRTSAIDRLIAEAVQTDVEMVINLGAGMDTRPYRMQLPPRLRWVEVDLPEVIEAKNAQLQGHRPACLLERVGADLLDGPVRGRMLAESAGTVREALVITEGVIPYFTNDDVVALAADLIAVPSIRGWILDFDNAGERPTSGSWSKFLSRAPFRFAVSDWFAFFERQGWGSRRIVTSAQESSRLERPFPRSFPQGLLLHALPKKMSERILSASGAALLSRRGVEGG